MKLIIGSNSKIIKKIRNNLINTKFLSHKEIHTIDFNKYSIVFLFSWVSNYKEMIDLVNLTTKQKIVFVSTVAIYSTYKRNQWNPYPKLKLEFEKYILSNGGSVLRLGIMEDDIKYFPSKILPVTTYKSLINCLTNYSLNHGILNLFKLQRNLTKPSFFEFISIALHKVSVLLPNMKHIRILLEILPKILNFKYYGYTADVIDMVKDEALIGYGVLGSSYYRRAINKPFVISSNKADYTLNSNGFRNSIVGKFKNGLAKYWHGAYILEDNKNYIRKSPFLISRPKPPCFHLNNDVDSIIDHKNFFEIKTNSNKIILTKKIIFSAGAFENTKLLCNLSKSNIRLIKFSDHELTTLGQIKADEAIKLGFLKSFMFILYKPKLFVINQKNIKALFEFRPNVNLRHESDTFYLDTTKSIIYKIIKQFSFSRFNEAFFTKFGFGFYTKDLSVLAQILNENCINYYPRKNLIKRNRLTKKTHSNIKHIFKEKFLSFDAIESNYSIDGQHIVGGSILLKDKYISLQLKEKRIEILGSPTNLRLDFRHPTKLLLNETNF